MATRKGRRPGRNARTERPEEEALETLERRADQRRVPHAPLVPVPGPDEEVGISGGPVHLLPTEFSWADYGGEENNLNVVTAHPPDSRGISRPGPHVTHTPEELNEVEKRFRRIAADAPSHPEEHRPNPLRHNTWLIDE